MGQIKVTKCDIEGLCVIEPTVHGDDRGYFMETYNLNDMKEAGLDMVFVQDNQSMSTKGVLRGLHYQKEYPQGKLVRVIKGRGCGFKKRFKDIWQVVWCGTVRRKQETVLYS